MRLNPAKPFLLTAVALTLVLSACGGGTKATPPPPTQPQATQPSSPTATLAGPAPSATATARPTPVPPPTATSAPISTGSITMGMAGLGLFELIMVGGTGAAYLDTFYDYKWGSNDNGKKDGTQGFATSWTIDPSGKIYTFKLRNDVVFHNGDKATAKDIVGDINRTSAADSKRVNNFKRDIAKMETPDDFTYVMTLNNRNLFFNFGNAPYVEPDAYITARGYDFANRNPIGSGPYKFKSLVLDDRITTEAVEKHWLFGVPRTKTLVFRVIPEETTRNALLKSGEVDFSALSRAGAPSMKNLPGVRVITRDESGVTQWRMESQWITDYPGYGKNPFADVRVRKALSWYGIDRDKIVKTFLDNAGSPTMAYPVTPGEPAYKALPVPAFDVAKAKELLKDAGYEKGFEFDFYMWPRPQLPEGTQIMEAMATWWEQLGLKVNRKPGDISVWRDKVVANSNGPHGAFDRPTVAGTYFLGNSSSSAAGTGSNCVAPFPPFSTNRTQALCDLGKIWENSANETEYIKNGQAWMQMKYDLAEDPVISTVGELFGVSAKVPAKWNPGKASFAWRLERAAGWRYE